MNILFLAHRLPYPPDKGDKIRSFNILKYLSQKHDVHLACLIDSKRDLNHIQAVARYCRSLDWVLINPKLKILFSVTALVGKKPLSIASFRSRRLQAKINKRLRETHFDVIFVFSSQMAEYVTHVSQIKRIMDFVDVDSRKWLQYARSQNNYFLSRLYKLESRRLTTYEKQIAEAFDYSIFVSESEVEHFRQDIYDCSTIAAVHNGVDFEYFSPNGKRARTVKDAPVILFTGAMDYYPNIDAVTWFAKKILPTILNEIPKCKFYIVGRNPHRQVQKLADGDNIIVTGYVKDIRPYFEQADVFVAPFRIACGIQNKILEALAMKLPVVTTSSGVEGLIMQDCPVMVKDEPADFAECVVELFEGNNDVKSSGFREWVVKHYDWNSNLSKLDKLLMN